MARVESILETQSTLIKEVIAVALADGVTLYEPKVMQAITQISETMGSQKSSTAQDMARFRPSEIDHLNGIVVRLGLKYGVPTPVNQTLFALVKLVESTYADKS